MSILAERLTPETTLRLTSRCSAPIEIVTTLLIFVLHPLSTGANRTWQASVKKRYRQRWFVPWQTSVLAWGKNMACCTLQDQKSFVGLLCVAECARSVFSLNTTDQAKTAYCFHIGMLALRLRSKRLKLIDKNVSVLFDSKGRSYKT